MFDRTTYDAPEAPLSTAPIPTLSLLPPQYPLCTSYYGALTLLTSHLFESTMEKAPQFCDNIVFAKRFVLLKKNIKCKYFICIIVANEHGDYPRDCHWNLNSSILYLRRMYCVWQLLRSACIALAVEMCNWLIWSIDRWLGDNGCLTSNIKSRMNYVARV